jgi:hypothetical protein
MDWTEAHLQGDLEAMQQAREEAIVRAALERAAETADSIALPMDGRLAKAQAHYMRSVIRDTTRSLASDPAEVAAIIKAAGEDRG